MKATSFLLLALGAASVFACEQYGECRCVTSDGSSNNTATDAICTYLATQDDVSTIEYGTAPDGGYECDYASSYGSDYDNCLWRIFCKIEGATGQDSSCRWKAGS